MFWGMLSSIWPKCVAQLLLPGLFVAHSSVAQFGCRPDDRAPGYCDHFVMMHVCMLMGVWACMLANKTKKPWSEWHETWHSIPRHYVFGLKRSRVREEQGHHFISKFIAPAAIYKIQLITMVYEHYVDNIKLHSVYIKQWNIWRHS